MTQPELILKLIEQLMAEKENLFLSNTIFQNFFLKFNKHFTIKEAVVHIYKKIAQNYDGLEYYDTNVTRTENTVVNDTTINYEKLDMDSLLAIEGEEDNVVEDGKVKLATWLAFAEKFGTVCEEVK